MQNNDTDLLDLLEENISDMDVHIGRHTGWVTLYEKGCTGSDAMLGEGGNLRSALDSAMRRGME